MFSKFLLGSIHVDDGVIKVLGRTPLDLLARHAVCDFGCINRRTQVRNESALGDGGEIISEYLVDPTDPPLGLVRVITAEGWGKTTITFKHTSAATTERKKNGTTF